MNQALASEQRLRPGTALRLALTLLALVAAVTLIGGTAATISTSTVNPGATFSAVGPELSAQVAGGGRCVTGGSATTCPDLFNQRVTVGEGLSATVTIGDSGSVPIGSLQLWSTGCRQGPRSTPFSGSGDLCAVTWLTIHDDLHDQCYFPVQAGGPCQFDAQGTLASFARRYGPSAPLDLPATGLKPGIPFTFAIGLEPSAGNEFQGRWAEFPVVWRAS